MENERTKGKSSKELLSEIVSTTNHKKKKSIHFSLSDLIPRKKSKNSKEKHLPEEDKKIEKKSSLFSFSFLKFGKDSEDEQCEAESSMEEQESVEGDCLSDYSSGDEKISKAFGFESNLTLTSKIKSSRLSVSINDNDPEMEQSMLDLEMRTLSFLNEDHEDTAKSPSKIHFGKNKLKKNSLIYNNKLKYALDKGSPQLSGDGSEGKKHVSMFSTQDSRRKTVGPLLNSSYLQDIKEQEFIKPRLQSIQELSAFNSVPHPQYCNSYFIPNTGSSNMVGNPQFPFNQITGTTYARSEQQKNFDISIDNIYNTGKTTLMIRHIPNKYTKELMLETIDEDFKGKYDFFYLPIDFKNNCNVGYAFINFKKLEDIEPFYNRFNNKRWERFNSEKICEIKYARIQGRDECKSHFRGSSLMSHPDHNCKPYIGNRGNRFRELVSQQKMG